MTVQEGKEETAAAPPSSTAVASTTQQQQDSPAEKEMILDWIPVDTLEPYMMYIKAVGGLVVAVFLVAPGRFLFWIWNLVWTIVGVSLGFGLGLGLALHIFHQLQAWQKSYDDDKQKINSVESQRGNSSGIKRKSLVRDPLHASMSSSVIAIGGSTSSFLEDGNSYLSLMAQAGYPIPDRVLRGQVLREDHSFWNVLYRFTDDTIRNQTGVRIMAEEFPALPEPVSREMGRFIEHVMRDYISGWYSILDDGVVYRNEEEKRKEGIPRDGGSTNDMDSKENGKSDRDESPVVNSSSSPTTPSKSDSGDRRSNMGSARKDTQRAVAGNEAISAQTPTDSQTTPSQNQPRPHVARKMVFSTLTHRRAPMIDCTYRVLSAAFGNLATRAEHVNVLELVLLKWTQVMGHTFKVYRSLRKVAQEKNASHGLSYRFPSEVEITREFLLAGKLHRAVIFGLDVPSLLFADASGKECGCGTDESPRDPSQVLEERLYNTNMVKECELDYNRVVASRLIRALLPKTETSSYCVMALVVEIFAGCVLQPLMNLWIPSFLNDIIVKAMASPKLEDDEVKEDNDLGFNETSTENHQVVEEDQALTGATLEVANNDSSYPDGHADLLNDNNDTVEDDVDRKASEVPETLNETATTSDLQDGPLGFLSTPGFHEISSASSSSSDDNNMDLFGEEDETTVGDKILTLSAVALAELAKFMDFDECRDARANNQETGIDWDDANCQTAVLRLVLVIEAALLDGRSFYRDIVKDVSMSNNALQERSSNESCGAVEPGSLEPCQDLFPETITHLFMDMTSDMIAFEKRILDYAMNHPEPILFQEQSPREFKPDANEISTLRTLITTWLHTGQVFKALGLVCRAADTVFAPFYANEAFVATKGDREKLVREMKVLDGVDVMVETMAVLASPRLDISDEYKLITSESVQPLNDPSHNGAHQNQAQHRGSDAGHASDSLARDLASFGDRSTPRFLDFNRNAAFASSLRAERDRRLRAWDTRQADENVITVIRKTAVKQIDFDLHSEMHNLSRLFYNGTNIMSIRDAARRNDEGEEVPHKTTGNEKVSLLTVDTASNRRRIEVPDDDSSFLLRAQSRPLNPVSVHRDDRNHEMSYKSFLATYEEPAIAPGSTRYNGGRLIRRCFLQYYPSDRTASIVLQSDARKLDRRKGKPMGNEPTSLDQNSSPYFNASFLRQRHLCQKWSQKSGVGSQSFLSSSLMESTDFVSAPRTGRALDFVYRMSLFERPVVDLAGKRFTIQDSSSRGVHRADASSLEVSDASLSYLLLYVGRDWGSRDTTEMSQSTEGNHVVEMGPDGYPMIFFRISTNTGEQDSTEIKPYRLSFVRAALLVTSSKQEAQHQSLVGCVRAGSAKSATKARTEEQLRPTLKILEFANDKSKDQSKASFLNRDLKLGIYHIDREQLRRNGLLSLRHPTAILQLNAKVEGTAPAKDIPLAKLISSKLLPDETLYKIRCTAVVELVDSEDSVAELEPYTLDDGSLAILYREEWIVYRSMKDFQTLHKQLKSQVSLTESSMSTGTRLVGAAAAALSSRNLGRRNKKILIPSLAQASKIGTMGVTKRSIAKRMELFDEYVGYLLSSNSLMNRCTELLLFLGASHPFPPEVTVTRAPANFMDPLGRMEFVRSVALKESGDIVKLKKKFSPRKPAMMKPLSRASVQTMKDVPDAEPSKAFESSSDIGDMDPTIASKVDQIALSEIRNRIVELMRYSFGFENASFIRSQMLAALETASFVAIAKQSDFRRVLYNLHSQQLNGDALGGWIRTLLDLLWPDGVWGKSKPLLTAEEEASLRVESRVKLHQGFPDKFRKILGKQLTKDGLDMIHDMLQNRLVVKSMFYMLFDLVWIELLPELRDSLPCASALDLDLL